MVNGVMRRSTECTMSTLRLSDLLHPMHIGLKSWSLGSHRFLALPWSLVIWLHFGCGSFWGRLRPLKPTAGMRAYSPSSFWSLVIDFDMMMTNSCLSFFRLAFVHVLSRLSRKVIWAKGSSLISRFLSIIDMIKRFISFLDHFKLLGFSHYFPKLNCLMSVFYSDLGSHKVWTQQFSFCH